jgi:phosphoribosylaminoimidazole-succinocarboxamide synthase
VPRRVRRSLHVEIDAVADADDGHRIPARRSGLELFGADPGRTGAVGGQGGIFRRHWRSVPDPMTSDAAQRQALAAHLPSALNAVPGLTPTHRGKVRDVFAVGADELLLVATDRVSAFDVVLGTIPLKGQLLTDQSAFWLERAQAVAKTHLLERVDAAVLRCRRAQAFPVEIVVRGHLAGSLMREPVETRGQRYGLAIDPHIAPYAPFPQPILTPTTKEAVGVHDQPCSLDDLVRAGRIERRHVDRVVEIAQGLFRLGAAHADAQGLILVDTKYEMGIVDGEVCVIDEVHTADSSRFWIKATYADRVARGEAPEMLDKENLRRWLLARGFGGEGTPPVLDDAIRVDVGAWYWTLTERVLGKPFVPVGGGAARVAAVVRQFLDGA